MRKPSTTRGTRTAVMMIAVLVVSAGCESTNNWLRGRKTAEAEPVILGAPEANAYLNEMYELASGDPATQAEIFADANSAATITPGTSTRSPFLTSNWDGCCTTWATSAWRCG